MGLSHGSTAGKSKTNWRNKNCIIHKADWDYFHKILQDENYSFQAFVEACIQALLRADPNMMLVLKDFKNLNREPAEQLSKIIFSFRERKELLDEFEKNAKVKGGEKL